MPLLVVMLVVELVVMVYRGVGMPMLGSLRDGVSRKEVMLRRFARRRRRHNRSRPMMRASPAMGATITAARMLGFRPFRP